MLHDHLRAIAQELEIDSDFQGAKPNTYEFPVDATTIIQLTDDEEGIFIQCTLCPAPTKNKEEIYQDLMSANLFGQGAFGATLGLTENKKHLLLTRLFNKNIDYQQFKDQLEDFINAAKFWQEKASPFV